MCFLPPIQSSGRSKKGSKRKCYHHSRSTSPLPIRVTDIGSQQDIHQMEYPIATLPDYLTTRYGPGIIITPPTFPTPPWSPPRPPNPYPPNPDPSPYSNRRRNRDHRTETLEEIEFVNTLKGNLIPPPLPAKTGPSETEKKIMEELKELGGMMKKQQRNEEAEKARAAGIRQGEENMRGLIGLHVGGNGNGGVFGGGNGGGWTGGGGSLVYGPYQRRRSSASDGAFGVVTRLLVDTVRGVESKVRRVEDRASRVEDRMSGVEWDWNDMQQRTQSYLPFRRGSEGRLRMRRVT